MLTEFTDTSVASKLKFEIAQLTEIEMTALAVLPAKSDSDVMFCLQLLSKTLINFYTPLELMPIDRTLVY